MDRMVWIESCQILLILSETGGGAGAGVLSRRRRKESLASEFRSESRDLDPYKDQSRLAGTLAPPKSVSIRVHPWLKCILL